jgi:hypothetical protein
MFSKEGKLKAKKERLKAQKEGEVEGTERRG